MSVDCQTYRPALMRRGFSLIEMLVVIAIIAILVAMLLPAVQQAREAARRTQCKVHLMQLSLALENYHQAHAVLPPGVVNDTGPIRNEAQGHHHGWLTFVLPYLDEQPLFSRIDRTASIYGEPNAVARQAVLPLLLCPSDPAARTSTNGAAGLTNYAGVHHPSEAPIDATNHGVLFLNSRVRMEDVPDGVSHTLFVGEIKRSGDDLGWASGTRASLRNGGLGPNLTPGGSRYYNDPSAAPTDTTADGQPSITDDSYRFDETVTSEALTDKALRVGGFGSYHTGGSHFALGDGSVRFISANVGLDVYMQLMDRGDGHAGSNTF